MALQVLLAPSGLLLLEVLDDQLLLQDLLDPSGLPLLEVRLVPVAKQVLPVPSAL